MLTTGQKLLHCARSLRRLHNHSHSQCRDADSKPKMLDSPASPASPTSSIFSLPISAPMPMSMPPTQRPRTEYGSCSGISISTHHIMALSDDEPFFFRQPSTCSQASRASSSWSSHASTSCSSTTSSRHAGLEWDSLRSHPVPSVPVVRASPQYYYEADHSLFCAGDDAYVVSSSSTYGLDLGSDRSSAAAAVRRTMADISLATSTDQDEGFEAQGLSAPPPSHHRRPRAHQSAENMQQTMRDLQLLGASGILDRPSTPPIPPASVSEPASPLTPRTQPHAANETERYLKRGDWKRRGIVFSAFDD
ncbi:hypothetical protein SEPCBS119000_004230 [Sporothrix epigloea]|uniref:Uncharacterized protein n=1 Tax=Sporothrix epigloea TaxID=1892477 RepID=A0ABP0DUU6_9PEZI